MNHENFVIRADNSQVFNLFTISVKDKAGFLLAELDIVNFCILS